MQTVPRGPLHTTYVLSMLQIIFSINSFVASHLKRHAAALLHTTSSPLADRFPSQSNTGCDNAAAVAAPQGAAGLRGRARSPAARREVRPPARGAAPLCHTLLATLQTRTTSGSPGRRGCRLGRRRGLAVLLGQNDAHDQAVQGERLRENEDENHADEQLGLLRSGAADDKGDASALSAVAERAAVQRTALKSHPARGAGSCSVYSWNEHRI